MATESSAVVRFISLAQQAQNPVLPSAPPPVTSDFGTEVLRPAVQARSKRLPLILGAFVLAGGAAGLGVYLGRSGVGSGSESPAAPAPAAAPARASASAPAPAARVPIAAGAPAAATAPADQAAPAPVPQVTSPVVSVPTDVLAATGFDIRVEPAATITLDGSLLGKAPLRVRNLQPGAHVIDIEAPAGYFSRRMEIALNAGEAKELRLALDAIEDDAVAAPSAAPADRSNAADSARPSRADLRRERSQKLREEKERRKEMRATRAAAAKAARAAARSGRQDRPEVSAQPLPAAKEADSAADAELEAAMAEITGKPAGKNRSAAARAGASLATSPASSAGSGTLMLGSKPPCDIVIDGKPTGLKTPQRAMELAPGTHSVVLVNKELGVEKKFKVKIASGKTTKAIQDLTSKLD